MVEKRFGVIHLFAVMGMSARYNVSLNEELIRQLNKTASELGIPTSKLIRLAIIDKLRKMGKDLPDDTTYQGARTDLPNRVTEAEKRRRREMRTRPRNGL